MRRTEMIINALKWLGSFIAGGIFGLLALIGFFAILMLLNGAR